MTWSEKQAIGKNYPKYDEYPTPQSVYEEVGGDLYKEYLANPEKYTNTCAIRLSVAFEKSGIDIGGDYNGKNGLKYYTSATRIAEALNTRFISTSQGYDMSNYGVVVQYKNSDFKGSVFHVDTVYVNDFNKGVFGHTLYPGYYNKVF